MYARRFSNVQNFVPPQHNLRNVIGDKTGEGLLVKANLSIRRQLSHWQNGENLKERIEIFIEKVKSYKKNLFLKSSPEKTLKMWAQQCEFILAQRVRRGQQMLCHYSKWWEEKALKEFLKHLRISLHRNGREFIIGALGVSLYNWEERRIADEEFQSHLEDLTYINTLKEATMCLECAKGQKSDRNTNLCQCGTGGVTNKSYDDWMPFIEKDDLVVWRRPHGEGLFQYKVYGSYHDVTAEDFLNTQVDTDYRKEWDTTAIQLEIGERDPKSESNSDILYWEMQWPRLFVNRDYVFNRRYKIFEDAKIIIIINKTTEYPKFPKYPDKYRVEDYWSCMVIKPYEEMKKPGIEFSLTYFDNPGVNIPASVTTWVAKSAMPDYLAKLRHASRNYMQYCLQKGVSKACELYKKQDRERREEEERNKFDYCSNDNLRLVLRDIFNDLQQKANEKLFKKSDLIAASRVEQFQNIQTQNDELQAQPTVNNNANHSSFWKYLHPLYYFT